MNTRRTAIALSALMCSVSVVAALGQIKPSVDTTRAPRIQLEAAIPLAFGNWRMEPATFVSVVNPQTQQVLDKLYGQVLARTYVNDRGYHVMLSVAYGDDQRGSLQAHKPEVCYVAQGFSLLSTSPVAVETPHGRIGGHRLTAQLGNRLEPITYWFTIGDQAVQTRFERRLAEVRATITGQVPDGLLFRVSSIDANNDRAWREQAQFINDLLSATRPTDRQRLSGLPANES